MNDLPNLLRSHRSIRRYQPTPLDPALIEEVCADAVAGGSSSGNLNSVSIVLTRDPDRKRRLYELHLEQPMVLEAPLVMTFCADWFRTREWLRQRGARDNFSEPARLSRRRLRRDDRRAERLPRLRGARTRHLLHGHDAVLPCPSWSSSCSCPRPWCR